MMRAVAGGTPGSDARDRRGSEGIFADSGRTGSTEVAAATGSRAGDRSRAVGLRERRVYLLLYLLGLAALFVNAPAEVWDPAAREFVIIVGLVGLWRYGWGSVHLIRSLIYRRRVFPRWRRAAELLAGDSAAGAVEGTADRVFLIITSFRIRAETTAAVYRAAVEEAMRYGGPVTIVASIVELADQRFIKAIFAKLRPPERVRLVFVRLGPQGKRDALAAALRAVARMRPRPDDAVVVMDGDSLLSPGTLARCLPFLRLMPDLAGLTTDEDAVTDGGLLMRHWHRLRFAQRHVLMSSLGLSRRLLVMTGRMSLYRASIATDPDFIDIVRNDALDHWRLGRITFLTGEDKSTWFWLLERGLPMLYVPDVKIWTIEEPPAPGFLRGSTQLMLRWFGNMLRSSGRAIELGPRRIGLFTWWCLIDQRLSMWTPLIGPTAALLFAFAVSPLFLYTYALWVATTRLVLTLGLLTVRERVSGLYPPLLYYTQVYGALVKTYVLFRLDRQRWTRQNIARHAAGDRRWHEIGSTFVHTLALATLVVVVAFLTGALELPPRLPIS